MTIWAVVPAAGTGSRMHSEIPKQYMPLLGQSVLNLTLSRLCAVSAIEMVVVALNAEDLRNPDSLWRRQPMANSERVIGCPGGDHRAQSVLNALDALAPMAQQEDWVLVHDAARPCVRVDDIRRLIRLLQNEPSGGLLAAPVRDTLKLADGAGRVQQTLDRQQVWSALTPQMFRFGMLRQALQQAAQNGVTVTDEAAAMEYLGHAPLLVQGASDNLKITHPEDLALAAMILTAQAQTERN